MNTNESRLITAIQHLLTTARTKAYYNEDYARIAELLDRADHFCNLAREGAEDGKLDRILSETSDRFPECSRSLLIGKNPDLK